MRRPSPPGQPRTYLWCMILKKILGGALKIGRDTCVKRSLTSKTSQRENA
jgi:hypothetical protein